MVKLKTKEEIDKLIKGGKILSKILKEVAAEAKPGVKTIELDALAERLIRQAGGRPSFKYYQADEDDPPFSSTLCTSVNDELVHAPASGRVLKSGDIISIDIGMEYQGLFTDTAVTVAIGKVSKEIKKLMKVTKKSLDLAIKQVKPGNHISDISRAVEGYAKKNGLAVVRDLVGHGVGYAVHEEPRVPNFVSSNQPDVKLVPGLVIAIEPMLALGSEKIKVLDDGWTIVMADGKYCAHFEHTVAVTDNGCLILT